MKMGLNTRTNTSLWKDQALIELNIAVLHSFKVSLLGSSNCSSQLHQFFWVNCSPSPSYPTLYPQETETVSFCNLFLLSVGCRSNGCRSSYSFRIVHEAFGERGNHFSSALQSISSAFCRVYCFFFLHQAIAFMPSLSA